MEVYSSIIITFGNLALTSIDLFLAWNRLKYGIILISKMVDRNRYLLVSSFDSWFPKNMDIDTKFSYVCATELKL